MASMAAIVRPIRGSGSTPRSPGSGNGSRLSQYGSVRNSPVAPSSCCRWLVPVRGSPAITTGGTSSTSSTSGSRRIRSVSSSRFFSSWTNCAYRPTRPAGDRRGTDR